MLPIPGKPVPSTPYGRRGNYWADGIHKGVDFSAIAGTQVFAPWSGRVISIGTWGPAFGDRSPVIDFDRLPDGTPGFWGVLAHLESCLVKPGDKVRAGQLIGTVGSRGNSTGPHLHFEVQRQSYWTKTGYVDPQKHLDAVPFLQDGKVFASRMWNGQLDSDSVRNVQLALNLAHRSPTVRVGGSYNDETMYAVQAFQKSFGWTGKDADGIVGPGTAAALGLIWVDDTEEEDGQAKENNVSVYRLRLKEISYHFSGKPKDIQVFRRRYTSIDNGRYAAPGFGVLIALQYLNLHVKFKPGCETGTVRLRLVRKSPDDPTAYQDFPISKNGTAAAEDGSVNFLITHVWFELCEKGRPLQWELDCSDDFEFVRGNTRYSKWLTLICEKVAG